MIIKHGEDYISIEFDCYADEDVMIFRDLKDIKNSVSIEYTCYVRGTGWGVVGGEHFFTKDILTLFEGFSYVLSNENTHFSHSGEFSHPSSDEPFYTFLVERQDDTITFTLKIHDCLEDYIQVAESMTVPHFKEIVDEFENAAKRFPVI